MQSLLQLLTDGYQLISARPADLPLSAALTIVCWTFVAAACVGSFLNVVIARVPAGISVVTPRSRCPKCGVGITAKDNIPIVSWLLLRARCRSCQAPIASRYPMIEALVGLLAVGIVMRLGLSFEGLEMFVFACVLVAIAWIDIDTWTVPNSMWIALAVSGVGFACASAVRADDWWVLWSRLIGAAGGGLMLSLVVVVATGVLRRTKKLAPDEWAMGWGDPLILIGVGAFVGYARLPLVLFLASLQGAIIGIALKASGKLNWSEPVSADDPWIPPQGALPFGPFLALGGLQAALFGDAIWNALLQWIALP